MARTKAYDRDTALTQAMGLFWEQGYSATSIQQLLDVMNISRSSLYEEFGSKQELFREALEKYHQNGKSLLTAIEGAETPVEAVGRFFAAAFFPSDDPEDDRGCLFVNAIVELRHVESELSSLASDYFYALEKALTEKFAEGKIQGCLPEGTTPEGLAAYYITLVKGLRVSIKEHHDRDYLKGVIETAKRVIEIKERPHENQ